MFGWKRLHYIQNKLCDSDIRETIANVSLIILFPTIFFYQTALGTRVMGPLLGSGWAFSVMLLFPCLSALYLFKFINERENIFLLDYLFCAFLGLISVVTFINFILPLPAQHNYQLLYWNIAGVISNATCFMAFRLANLNRHTFILSMWLCAILIIIIFVQRLNSEFYFSYARDSFVMSYQGFARSALIVFLFVSITSKHLLLVLIPYVIFFFALLGMQSRTELIIFSFSIPLAIFLNFNHEMQIKVLKRGACAVALGAILCLSFDDLILKFLSNFEHVRLSGLFAPSTDQSLTIRIEQTFYAVSTIIESPFFGDYGSYLLRANEAGHYSHNFLSVWVNLGLVGFLLYCCLCFLVLKFCFFENTTEYRKHNSLFAGAMGLSAVVAHVFSYPYVEVLLACSIGAISQYKEMRTQYNKNSFD